ncbi:CHAP domain-containing protein [Chromobacterium sp.]|uniref:CHAP domain-containing protein n=1 Tax=Chromobacterium sp. TaxID=306190 RepID=UPI0035B442D9
MKLGKGKAALALLALLSAAYWAATHLNSNWARAVGEPVDAFNGVAVYYNGGVQNVEGRNLAPDGYNLGLRYQCVEFVKRYYHQRFGHKMPQDKGHARDFFLPRLDNGALNPERGLLQYRNGDGDAPREEDLIVFAPWVFNRYGHVAIVSRIGPDFIEIIQQNPGPFGDARERLPLLMEQGVPRVGHQRVLGWLRRAPEASAPAEAIPPADQG